MRWEVEQRYEPSETDTNWKELTIVSRKTWGANVPKWTWPLRETPRHVLCTYTNRDSCTNRRSCISELQMLQSKAMNYDDNPDIRFSFLIGGDSVIYEGRGWLSQPKVPKRYGWIGAQSYYIGFIGSFKTEPPTQRMFEARDDLLKYAVWKGHLKPNFLHYTM